LDPYFLLINLVIVLSSPPFSPGAPASWKQWRRGASCCRSLAITIKLLGFHQIHYSWAFYHSSWIYLSFFLSFKLKETWIIGRCFKNLQTINHGRHQIKFWFNLENCVARSIAATEASHGCTLCCSWWECFESPDCKWPLISTFLRVY
jgi:hypothetical protein